MKQSCKLCKERGKTWKGSDPICAFGTKPFEDNWNCATLFKIREIANTADPTTSEMFIYYADNDDRFAAIAVSDLELEGHPTALCLGWYKSRGCTGSMYLAFSDKPPRMPTEDECLKIIARYKEYV